MKILRFLNHNVQEPLRKVSAIIGRGFISMSFFLALCGCGRGAEETVILYTSVDQRFAQQVIRDFEQQTNITVKTVFDSEAGKTTGLLRRLRRERDEPRCDVWWSSEVFGTIELAREKLLSPYASPAAHDIPALWKDPDGRWTALAARARVIAFDPQRVSRNALPRTWHDLVASDQLNSCAIANPNFGTTRGHVAAMVAFWGPQSASNLLQNLRDSNAAIADGNAHAVRLVANGSARFCLTDTDDVWVAQQRGDSLALIYPTLDDDLPVCWIPCTVAHVRNGPNPENARKLIDYLVSATVERALANSDSHNVPVRAQLHQELLPDSPAPEPLDFERIADALPDADRLAREILLR